MNIESFRSYCLGKRGVTEEFPFGEHTLVFKVMGKMFALTNIEHFDGINLKVDPEEGAELREHHEAVLPAYHMNKKHWITVRMDGRIPDQLVRSWIDKSYWLVVQRLPKSIRSSMDSL